MRCGIYARFSTENQSETSISDQFRVCREYAARAGWAVVLESRDEGISGAALGNRPGVRELEQAALGGALDVVLVTDLTRLSRSQGDLLKFIERLRFRHVAVIGVQDGYHSDHRTARMQAGLSGIMSEEFRAMIADRTRSALQSRAQEGRPTGGRAYGYQPGEAEIVREIFARIAAGEGMKTVAKDLNARGIPSPGAAWRRVTRAQHGRWLASAIHAIVRNERYAGRITWNRSRWVKDPDSGRRVRRERPPEEWIQREIEPLVDAATWHAAQLRAQPVRSGAGGAPRYVLSGLMSCAVCGSKFIVIGGRQQRYGCGTHHAGGEHACSNGLSVPRQVAEQHILAPVLEDLRSPQIMRRAAEVLDRERPLDAISPEEQELRALRRMVREGVVSASTLRPAIEEARRKAQERRFIDAGLPSGGMSSEAWARTVDDMADILKGEDAAAARVILRQLIGEVRMVPEDDRLVAELTARQIVFKTGSGRWSGSGGVQRIYFPRGQGPRLR
jgi:DNA invertase Pin-like site-specific DNA recombinase